MICLKVLLIEDDVNLAMGIAYALKNEGFSVDKAATCQEAMTLFGKTTEFVLLDVMLPDGTGYDILSKIRKTSKVPVIFLTACDEEVNIIMGLDAGADDYITKPIRVKELVSRIRAVLRRQGSDSVTDNSGKLLSSSLEADVLASKVLKNGTEIALTALEYRLLLAFMNHPNQILSRNKLLEMLWDSDGNFVDDNALSVYIRRLREKIECDPDNPELIKTIRGSGYKWGFDVLRC